MEVETPILSHGTVTDVHLDAFQCEFDHAASGDTELLYLQTSPEFAMKRLLAAGSGSIYQLGKAFRHEAQGRFHNPEFTMLEWYRIDFDMMMLIDEVDALLQTMLGTAPCRKLSYAQAFNDYLAIDVFAANAELLKAKVEEQQLAGDWLAAETSIDTLLQFLFSMCIEPRLQGERPTCIYHFPASQASLAQLNKEDKRLAQRFEFYHQGIELANGFEELTDAKEQLFRFEQDNKTRSQLNLPEKPIDNRFISALQHGLPACSGVALGVDRLLMLRLGVASIEDVIAFTSDRS